MGLLILLVAGSTLGAWVLRALRLPGGIEGGTIRLLVGLCLCSVIIMTVGSVSLALARSVMLVLALVGLGCELFVRNRRRVQEAGVCAKSKALSLLEKACLAATASALLLSFLGALAPVTSWDACVAHIALPSDYAREGRILLLEGNNYSAYPHLMHCLFAYAFYESGELESGELGAMLTSWAFGALACLAAYSLGQRVHGRLCGLIGAAMLATAPIFIDQAGTVALDLAFAALTLAALVCLFAWRDAVRHTPDEGQVWLPVVPGPISCSTAAARRQGRGWLVVAALLAGSSCGVRNTGYILCVVVALTVLGLARGNRLRATALFVMVGVAASSPWLLRSALLVGNPFYPLLTSVFPNALFPDVEHVTVGTHTSLRGTGLMDLIRFPWNIIMRPYRYDGWAKSPGGLLLVFAPIGVLLGGRRILTLTAVSVAGGLCFFYSEQLARYFLPFFALMMVVAASGAARLVKLRQLVGVVLVVMFGYGLILQFGAIHFKLPVVFGVQSREAYLEGRVERYAVFQWINENIDSNDMVYTFDQRSYYLRGATFQNLMVMPGLAGESIEKQVAWFHERDIHYVLVPKTFMESSGGFEDMGILAQIEAWEQDRRHFELKREFRIETPGRGEAEIVRLYLVHYLEDLGQLKREYSDT